MQTSPLKGEDVTEVKALLMGSRQSAGRTCAPWDRNRNVNSQEKEECHLPPSLAAVTQMGEQDSQQPGPCGRDKHPSQQLLKVPPRSTVCVIMSEKGFLSIPLCSPKVNTHFFFLMVRHGHSGNDSLKTTSHQLFGRIPPGFFLGVHRLWGRRWHPTSVLLPGKSHGQRSLVDCSPWGR